MRLAQQALDGGAKPLDLGAPTNEIQERVRRHPVHLPIAGAANTEQIGEKRRRLANVDQPCSLPSLAKYATGIIIHPALELLE
jgi:hypothetical protein